jgi:hypothetical protein
MLAVQNRIFEPVRAARKQAGFLNSITRSFRSPAAAALISYLLSVSQYFAALIFRSPFPLNREY